MTTISRGFEARGPNSNSLQGRFVFLSASFPDSQRAPKLYESANPYEITQAVVAAVRAVLSADGRLVFGGHPTISPLVMMVAQEYVTPGSGGHATIEGADKPRVVVYQSRVFSNVISTATQQLFDWDLAELVWSEADSADSPILNPERGSLGAERSLRLMRLKMFSETKPVGAIFIGGMQGIRDEADLLSERYKITKRYFIGGPGGAARQLVENNRDILGIRSGLEPRQLAESRSYPTLMQRIVIDIAGSLPIS